MRGGKILFSDPEDELSMLIATKLGISSGNCHSKMFLNGEISVEIASSVRNEEVFIIQSGSGRVNSNLMELFILIDACKRASARKITAGTWI